MKELEIAGLASIGGWLSRLRKHADIPVGSPCPNCETVLQGPFCHACGQMAEDYHKSIWRLFMEVVESFTNFDGRLWRTLPNLVWRPGRLTRAFLDGKRAPQVPPFRMFLIALLIAFLAGQCSMQKRPEGAPRALPGAGVVAPEAAKQEVLNDPTLSAEEKKTAVAAIEGDWMTFGRSIGEQAERERAKADAGKAGAAKAPEVVADKDGLKISVVESDSDALNKWIQARADAIKKNPELFWMVLEKWASRVAILALPVSALILSLLFIFQRRFYVFDHLVFSMHSLTFQLLLLTVILLGSIVTGPVIWWLILLSPVHLFAHMRGTYGTGVFLTLVRMWFLWFFTTIAFSALAVLWLYLGFNEMGGH